MDTISKATEYNWKRLNSDSTDKLTRRANKTRSSKRVMATSYLDFEPANRLVKLLMGLNNRVDDVIYTLCLSCLEHYELTGRKNVSDFLSSFSDYNRLAIDIPTEMWKCPDDVLGFIYQSLITEGERNLTGQYYTHGKVAAYMINGKSLKDGETFLDPCCGSGSFLLSVNTNTPSCLYGFDINPVAVMIAGTNLLVKYKEHDFSPNVYCLDYLTDDVAGIALGKRLPTVFDNIYTNPPWGTDKQGLYQGCCPEIRSREKSSMFIVESLRRLSVAGELYFLLPTSLLKIKIHNDVRRYILDNVKIERIDIYANRFDGVFTDFFSIKMTPGNVSIQDYEVTDSRGNAGITLSAKDMLAGNIIVQQMSDADLSIFDKIESRRHDDLTHSSWALGIVTGDNKAKVKKEQLPGMEPVYGGKHVAPYKLLETKAYIYFAPETFQQCAREEYFRAPEKLVYRFIGKYPIVAYDNKKRLCLNSANILIPRLDGITIKAVAALLNSKLYRYYYSTKFTDIKVLKGNLQLLPFPQLTESQDKELNELVDVITSVANTSEDALNSIDEIVYRIFEITSVEQFHIEEKLRSLK